MPRYRQNMPTIARVSGIKVMIYYNDHAPPHVHLSKGDVDVVASILDPGPLGKFFSRSDARVISAWILSRQPQLLANWELARRGLPMFEVE